MRQYASAAALAASLAFATAASAQADRYGGMNTYAGAPAPQRQGPAAPVQMAQQGRVLTWPGKTTPVAPQPQQQPQPYGYGYPPPAQPAYGAGNGLQPPPYNQQQRPAQYAQPYPMQPQAPPYGYAPAPQGAPPPGLRPTQPASGPPVSYQQGWQPQPYYAPAPGTVAPPPGSTATAPFGVYPANTVPPQLAYPMAVPPQAAQPLVGPPTSIYAPPPQQRQQPQQQQGGAGQAQTQAPPAMNNQISGFGAQKVDNPADPSLPYRLAANMPPPSKSARIYSLHRQFGMQPDPTPAATPTGEAVQLVSPIDSGPGPDPAGEGSTVRTRQTNANGKTVMRTAQLRDADPPN